MRVLNIAYPFAPVRPDTAGGAEQVVGMLDRGLCRAGHESFVVACDGSQVSGKLLATEATSGVLDPGTQRRVRLAYRDAIAQAIGRWKPDLVHLHGIDFPQYLPPAGVPA